MFSFQSVTVLEMFVYFLLVLFFVFISLYLCYSVWRVHGFTSVTRSGPGNISVDATNLSPERRFLLSKESEKLGLNCGKKPTKGQEFNSLFGRPLSVGEAPWAVALNFGRLWFPKMSDQLQQMSEEFICTGTLISSRHVITSSACLGPKQRFCKWTNYTRANPRRWAVYVGTRCANQKICEDSKRNDKITKAKVARMFVEHNEKECSGTADSLAIFELEKDIVPDWTVYPACLPTSLPNLANQIVEISGFGQDMGQDTTYLPNRGILKKDTHTIVACPFNSTICTKATTHTGLCAGDTGSGLVFRDEVHQEAVVVGVAGLVRDDCKRRHNLHMTGLDDVKEYLQQLIYHEKIEASWPFICLTTGICYEKTVKDRVSQHLMASSMKRPRWARELGPLGEEDMYAL